MVVEQAERMIQRAAESLYEDEILRSNMTDDEANMVFDWAISWVGCQMRLQPNKVRIEQVGQQELTRVRSVIKSLNALAGKDGAVTLNDVLAALQSSLDAQSLTHAEVFRLITVLATEAWKTQDRKI